MPTSQAHATTEHDAAVADLQRLARLLEAARSGLDGALARALEVLVAQRPVDYARLEAGGGAAVVVECERNRRGEAEASVLPRSPEVLPRTGRGAPERRAWARGRRLPVALARRGLVSAVVVPASLEVAGALTVGSRDGDVTSSEVAAFIEAAAAGLGLALERRALELEAERLQRVSTAAEVAAAVVHDVNNALTAIIGCATLARSHLDETHPAWRPASLVDSLAASTGRLTRQLLELVRGSAGTGERLDVNAAVVDGVAFARRALPEGVTVALDLSEALPPVEAEAALLQHALLNLLLNAAEAMPAGGHIHVRTSASPGVVVVTVADEGVGIESAVLTQVFEPFFTTKRGDRGTGLGLTSVRRIARRFGGSVEAASAPGRGSTFSLVLPASPRGDADAEAPGGEPGA